jgi:C-terminal processing protease CtpA/Prc
MKVGAEVTAFNGVPIKDAISQVKPLGTQSTDFGLRYEQVMMLPRCAVGTKATITFKNEGETAQTVTLTSIQDLDSLYATYNGGQMDENALPVEFKILPQGAGYVKINSNYDDLNLIVRLFMRALDTFKKNNVPGIIIDMRHNFGGSPLGLAGFLYNQKIIMGQLEYYSDKTGKFEPEGPPEKVYPNVEQYQFGKEVLLVDQFCYSACEIESYGFSQVPGMLVMGQFPTAGVEAETARGDFKMPDGMEITIPTGRFILPDGSLFLEGKGVQPTVRIPVDRNSVLSGTDVVLQKAIDQILSGK